MAQFRGPQPTGRQPAGRHRAAEPAKLEKGMCLLGAHTFPHIPSRPFFCCSQRKQQEGRGEQVCACANDSHALGKKLPAGLQMPREKKLFQAIDSKCLGATGLPGRLMLHGRGPEGRAHKIFNILSLSKQNIMATKPLSGLSY